MFKAIGRKLFGTRHEREAKKIQPLVDAVNAREAEMQALSDEQLRAKTDEFRSRLKAGETLDDLLPEAFAAVREASWRVLKMRHYDVQIFGGVVLHTGRIAEMKTGEGKTLVATLPLYLNALAGEGVHLVTVNGYLAERDAEWMGQIYNFLGLSYGVIKSQMPDADRRAAYAADITYGTNNEFGFDYLRDNMKFSLAQRVQRGLKYAIVDEVDSILIDEARTPLIISGQGEASTELYYEINKIVPYLKRDEDYIVDEQHRSVSLTEEGIEKVEKRLNIENLFEPTNIQYFHHVSKALQAHTLYKRDVNYVVKDGKVVIIDEFTGRLMDGRRWSDGLHQAVEAKEAVTIENENQTLATVTFQNFFRLYGKLAGMTGTADTEAEEFGKTYKLDVVVIPTNRPVLRLDQPDLVYKTERGKFTAIVEQIVECHKKGQPVLVGTISVEKSEAISKVLKKHDIPHSLLNAKQHAKEALIVAQAGRKGAVTIATNMAGRGTDILLGGNPIHLAKAAEPDESSIEYATHLERFSGICAREREEVLAAGGLFILGTERHDSRRIDNQLRGRAGRQGDPGESRFYLSLEDDLMRRFGVERISGWMDRLGMEEHVPIEHKWVTKSIESAQARVEGRNFDIRKNLLEYDEVLDAQRKAIYGLRDEILGGETDLRERMLDLYEDTLVDLIQEYGQSDGDAARAEGAALGRAIKDTFGVELDLDEVRAEPGSLEESLWKRVAAAYKGKEEELDYVAERFNERFAEDAENVERKSGKDILADQERYQYLREIDKRWREHLNAMTALRDAVSLHGYAQKDPKNEYKKEGYEMFQELLGNIRHNVTKYLFHMRVKKEESVEQPQQQQRAPVRIALNRGPDGSAPASGEAAKPLTFRREEPKAGRNDPCPCGSGKKYKKCCMLKEEQAAL
jgi:preprotein translocase subunit SecA